MAQLRLQLASMIIASTTLASSMALAQTPPLAATPHELPPVPPPPVHRSQGLRITGIALTSLAAAGGLAGTSVMLLGSGACTDSCTRTVLIPIGALTVAASALLAAGSVPMWVVGSETPRADRASTGAIPAFSFQGTGATLRWTF